MLSRRYTDFARATRDVFTPGPTLSGLNRYLTNNKTHNFAELISFAEHWKLVAESSELHLMLSAFFSNSK